MLRREELEILGIIDTLKYQLAAQKQAVEKFLSAKGNDLCFENRKELAKAFGLENFKPELISEEEFRKNCDQYAREIYGYSCPFDEE